MSPLGIIFMLLCCWLMISGSRQRAMLGLCIAALWVPRTQELVLGPIHFSILRLAILSGALRVVMRGERIVGRWNILDSLITIWAVWAVFSAAFHPEGFSMWRFGEVYTALGIYLLCRVLVRSADDVRSCFRTVCLLLPVVGAAMLIERATGTNVYAAVFGDPDWVMERVGHFRARGPFVNAITAGTTGGLCVPMALYLWQRSRSWAARLGVAGAVAIVLDSGASGPVLTTISIVLAMCLWRVRRRLGLIRWGALGLILVLNLIMSDPVYFLIARIDITGGSTSYYRAALIQSAIEHINEWWLVGTDVTIHWARTHMSDTQTDITNHYIQMGVWGGMLLLFLFVAGMWAAFACIGKVRYRESTWGDDQFLIWTIGAMLFGDAVTFFSISYFDQSNVFLFYLVLAIIAGCYSSPAIRRVELEACSVADDETLEPAGVGLGD